MQCSRGEPSSAARIFCVEPQLDLSPTQTREHDEVQGVGHLELFRTHCTGSCVRANPSADIAMSNTERRDTFYTAVHAQTLCGTHSTTCAMLGRIALKVPL